MMGDSPSPDYDGLRSAETEKNMCQAEGCRSLLACLPRYCRLRRLCPVHLKAQCLRRKNQAGDQLWRFCQQCGKLEPLHAFDDNKRSCRLQLARRRGKPSQQVDSRSTPPGTMTCWPLDSLGDCSDGGSMDAGCSSREANNSMHLAGRLDPVLVGAQDVSPTGTVLSGRTPPAAAGSSICTNAAGHAQCPCTLAAPAVLDMAVDDEELQLGVHILAATQQQQPHAGEVDAQDADTRFQQASAQVISQQLLLLGQHRQLLQAQLDMLMGQQNAAAPAAMAGSAQQQQQQHPAASEDVNVAGTTVKGCDVEMSWAPPGYTCDTAATAAGVPGAVTPAGVSAVGCPPHVMSCLALSNVGCHDQHQMCEVAACSRMSSPYLDHPINPFDVALLTLQLDSGPAANACNPLQITGVTKPGSAGDSNTACNQSKPCNPDSPLNHDRGLHPTSQSDLDRVLCATTAHQPGCVTSWGPSPPQALSCGQFQGPGSPAVAQAVDSMLSDVLNVKCAWLPDRDSGGGGGNGFSCATVPCGDAHAARTRAQPAPSLQEARSRHCACPAAAAVMPRKCPAATDWASVPARLGPSSDGRGGLEGFRLNPGAAQVAAAGEPFTLLCASSAAPAGSHGPTPHHLENHALLMQRHRALQDQQDPSHAVPAACHAGSTGASWPVKWPVALQVDCTRQPWEQQPQHREDSTAAVRCGGKEAAAAAIGAPCSMSWADCLQGMMLLPGAATTAGPPLFPPQPTAAAPPHTLAPCGHFIPAALMQHASSPAAAAALPPSMGPPPLMAGWGSGAA